LWGITIHIHLNYLLVFNGCNKILSGALGVLNCCHFGLLIGLFWFVRNFVFDLIKRYQNPKRNKFLEVIMILV
jgi:hypothetical protein